MASNNPQQTQEDPLKQILGFLNQLSSAMPPGALNPMLQGGQFPIQLTSGGVMGAALGYGMPGQPNVGAIGGMNVSPASGGWTPIQNPNPRGKPLQLKWVNNPKYGLRAVVRTGRGATVSFSPEEAAKRFGVQPSMGMGVVTNPVEMGKDWAAALSALGLGEEQQEQKAGPKPMPTNIPKAPEVTKPQETATTAPQGETKTSQSQNDLAKLVKEAVQESMKSLKMHVEDDGTIRIVA